MPRRLPSLTAIRAFEAAARLSSFTRAAEEIGTTQSGVSRLIRTLEMQIGHTLFVRANRRVDLTPAGRSLAPALTVAFDGIALAFMGLDSPARQTINLTATPAINPSWLVSRIGDFQERYPDIDVSVEASADMIDLGRSSFNVALRGGLGHWPGLVAHKLAERRFTPLCAPDFLARHGPLRTPADLLGVPRIQPRDPMWQQWFATVGVSDAAGGGVRTMRLAARSMYGDAALAARGVAMLMPVFYERELQDGRLVRPFEATVDDPSSAYWFCYHEAQKDSRAIALLRRWLIDRA